MPLTIDARSDDRSDGGGDWLSWPLIVGLLVAVPTIGFMAGMYLAAPKQETVFVREYTSPSALPDYLPTTARTVVVPIQEPPTPPAPLPAPTQIVAAPAAPAKAFLPPAPSSQATAAQSAKLPTAGPAAATPRAAAPRAAPLAITEAAITLPQANSPSLNPLPVLPRANDQSTPRSAPNPPAAATPSAAPPPRAARLTDGAGILAIQPFATSATAPLETGGSLRLIDLNAGVHRSFLLERRSADGLLIASTPIENTLPGLQQLRLTPEGLILSRQGRRIACGLADDNGQDIFAAPEQPYTSFCQGTLWRRATKPGWRTTQESVVQALRDSGSMGESVISFVKATIGRDEYSEKATARGGVILSAPDAGGETMPLPARTAERRSPVDAERLGVALRGAPKALELGRWYRSASQRGVYASVMAPGDISPDLLASYGGRVNPLDDVERDALVYLVAFDLSRFELDFRVGSEHPRVGWSNRVDVLKDGAGPDGFDQLNPLARVGMPPPDQLARLVATFAGGFKREHGAFKGPGLGRANRGSHYGFVENGVILSRPNPGLISLIGYTDGVTELRSWRPEDDALLDRIRFVRQNGTPIIEDGAPHPYIRDWLLGNWSGSAQGALRALRTGLCMQGEGPTRHLIYAYFTTATPSAMARVFQAYRCQTAMHLDMNAPELTYAAVYGPSDNGVGVRAEHLNRGMAGADPNPKQGQLKFATVTDNRDFFAVLRR